MKIVSDLFNREQGVKECDATKSSITAIQPGS
jgi:hypothetical protein